MSCVYCGRTKKKNQELSFHQFPKDEKLAKIWLKNMEESQFVPKKGHMLCAKHFAKNCIDFRDFRARLRKGSVPTIFKHNQGNISLTTVTEVAYVDRQRKLDDSKGEQIVTGEVPHSISRIEAEIFQSL